jgi:thiamine pyrophosphokinase
MFFRKIENNMKAVIIGNGPPPDALHFLDTVKGSDLLIAADGGADHCEKLNLIPDILIGDFDSITPSQLEFLKTKSTIYQFPSDKDLTDIELAMREAERRGAKTIKIFSWADERLDYSWNTLVTAASLQSAVELCSLGNSIYILNEHRPKLDLRESGKKISIFPLFTPVTLESKGLRWELSWKNVDLTTRSQSNEIRTPGEIKIHSGAAFALIEKP